MKKKISILLTALLLFSLFSISASAEQQDILLSRTVEVLENGDTIVTELYQSVVQPRTGASGHKTAKYYNSDGTAIWDVTVDGTFTYNSVTATATSAKATVNLYSNKASFISKNAYTSGNTATATGTVAYSTVSTTRSVSVSCDKYGVLY